MATINITGTDCVFPCVPAGVLQTFGVTSRTHYLAWKLSENPIHNAVISAMLSSAYEFGAFARPPYFCIPLGDLVDFEKEIARLNKELDNLRKEIARAEGKLNNQGFIAKAPAALVEQEKAKLALNQQKLEQVEKRLAELKESI